MEIGEYFKVFLLAMTPFGELRIAIPLGLTLYKLDTILVFLFAILGNLSVVILVLVFLNFISKWLSEKIYFFNRFFAWLFSKTRKNHEENFRKYGLYFLPIFVAIPLPFTGGWTGALISFVFGIPFKKAFPLISLGILGAGIIVLFLTETGIAIEKHFGWQALFGILLFSFIFWFYKQKIKIRIQK